MKINRINNLLFIIIIAVLILIFLVNTSSAVLDCSKCHKSDIGKAIIAKDTIEVSNSTCLKCHSSDYPPVSIGYNTHLAHVGKFSVKADYLGRHPKIEGLNCDSCHVNIGTDCTNCHRINIPHISGGIGRNCKGCHGEIDKLFRHPSIELKIHNIFNLGSNNGSDNKTTCTMCHNPDNMQSLKLANGNVVSTQDSHALCYQCHSGYYKLWDSGSHYSSKILPIVLNAKEEREAWESIKDAWQDNWRKQNTCANCHNPHNPSELYQLPQLEGVKEATGMTNVLSLRNIYIIGIAIGSIIIILIILLVLKKKVPIKISIPKVRIPRISIPISISVEKDIGKDIGKVENIEKDKKYKSEELKEELKGQIADVTNIAEATIGENEALKKTAISENEELKGQKTITDVDDALTKSIDKLIDGMGNDEGKIKKRKFLQKHSGNIIFFTGIGIILILFYAIFGTFIPMTIVISESMSPHMERGDIIFFTDISKISEIKTYQNKDAINFEDYGDVILYKPFGKEGVTPVVHRAMYYIKEGNPMWNGGPSAPYDGYVTKGDNEVTNPKYDQEVSTSYQAPVKKEWIKGVTRFRIPYVGYIRLILPI